MQSPLLPRELVHKQHASNVFVGEPRATGNNLFETESFFPFAHEFYNDSISGLSASGYLIEVARQANLAICHRFLDVPLDAGFLVTAIDWCFSSEAPFVVQDADDFVVRTEVVSAMHRKGTLAKLSTRSSFLLDSEVFLSGGASFLIASRRSGLDPDAPAPPAALPPAARISAAEAQVLNARDVLIGPLRSCNDGAVEVPLVVDATHPFFFEHGNEHVPGMMLLEAGKQAAVYGAKHVFPVLTDTYGDLHSGEIRFGRFASRFDPLAVVCRFGTLGETPSGFVLPVELAFHQTGRELGKIGGNLAFIARELVVHGSGAGLVGEPRWLGRAVGDNSPGAF